MGISVDALTALGAWTTVLSFLWMALVGEPVGPLVWRLWRARRARQEEEQPVMLPVIQDEEVEPEWSRTLRDEMRAANQAAREESRSLLEKLEEGEKREEEREQMRKARDERRDKLLEDLREVMLLDTKANVGSWRIQLDTAQRLQAASSSS